MANNNYTEIEYVATEEFTNRLIEILTQLVERYQLKKICEIGGGANPFLKLNFCKEKKINYTIVDISRKELSKAPEGYKFVCMDILDYKEGTSELYDLIFSRMFVEHISNGKKLHKRVFNLLSYGGYAVHYFPTLFAIPFIFNRILPDSTGYRIIQYLFPGVRDQGGNRKKFKAYYSWCYGPTKKQIERFEMLGYKVINYIGIYGHGGYYKPFPILRFFHRLTVKLLLLYPVPLMTSYSCVILKKQ